MMRTCHYYWLIKPLRKSLEDSGTLEPAFSVPIKGCAGDSELCLFTDEKGLPEFARLSFKTEGDIIDEAFFPLLLMVREHLLSVLRLSYSSDIAFFPRPVWTFTDVGQSPNMKLQFDLTYGQVIFDAEATRNLFAMSFNYREEVRLILDGSDKRLPLQYRFLSLYRLFEMYFRSRGEWDKQTLTAVFSQYEQRLNSLGFKQKPINELHRIRDLCAHIRNKTQFGVTHLNHEQTSAVERFLPVLLEASVELLNNKTGGQFKICHGQRSIL